MAGRHPVLTALSAAYEADLVGALERARGEVLVVRRCVDLADLLAAASGGRAVAALVSADLRRLDRDALARLRAQGLAVVGVADPGSAEQAERLRALGVEHAVAADAEPALVDLAVAEALSRPSTASVVGGVGGRPGRRRRRPPRRRRRATAPARPRTTTHRRAGRLVAVWGPVGSPGRTTVATTLAAELALLRHDTLLVDADTYGASVAQMLGVLDEAPGLAAACRSATAGSLDPVVLARLAPVVAPHLRVLTGITRADRWPEVGATGLEQVWAAARALGPWTVVDTGFALERDEELSYDTLAPRRNAATLAALEAADVVAGRRRGRPGGDAAAGARARRAGRAVPAGAAAGGAHPGAVVRGRVRPAAAGHRRAAPVRGRRAGRWPCPTTAPPSTPRCWPAARSPSTRRPRPPAPSWRRSRPS